MPRWLTRQVIKASLLLLDLFYRVDQHQDVQKQFVSDPEEQHYLYHNEYSQRPVEPEGDDNGKLPLDTSFVRFRSSHAHLSG